MLLSRLVKEISLVALQLVLPAFTLKQLKPALSNLNAAYTVIENGCINKIQKTNTILLQATKCQQVSSLACQFYTFADLYFYFI